MSCVHCGGTAGTLVDGAHALCKVRKEFGLATPSLGDRCQCCSGTGRHPRGAVGPTNPNQDAIERWAPACVTCAGSGTVRAVSAVPPQRKVLHWADGCTPDVELSPATEAE